MAFKAGQSGNPGGRPKNREWTDALRIAVKRADGDRTILAAIAEKVAQEALAGNMAAVKEIGDRLEGRSSQALQVAHSGAVATFTKEQRDAAVAAALRADT